MLSSPGGSYDRRCEGSIPNDPEDPEEEFASHILARAASSVEDREVTLYFE